VASDPSSRFAGIPGENSHIFRSLVFGL
jgi:hypothetical protein